MNYLSADHPNRPCSTTVGDKPGHLYSIDQINCTAIKDEIAGMKIKSGRMATTTKYAFTGTFQERRLSIRKQQVVMPEGGER
jgi:hypothetical protein